MDTSDVNGESFSTAGSSTYTFPLMESPKKTYLLNEGLTYHCFD